MKKVLLIIAILIVVVVGAIVALPFVVPKSTMVDFVVDQVEEVTGRKVVVAGEPDFSIFPEVKLSISQVSLANAEGGKAANLAEIGSADIEVDLMAALSGEVVVHKFVLVDPVIAIEKDANGRFNFEFGDGDKSGDAGSSGSGGEQSDGGGESGDLPLSLNDVRLENATLIYDDAQTGERQEIKGFNATIKLPSFEGPFDLAADAEWQGRRIDIVAQVDNPKALSEGKGSSVNATVNSADLVAVSFDGKVAAGAVPEGAGKVSVDVQDLGALLAWVQVELGPDVKLPKTISIAGDMTGSPDRVSLGAATIGFDANRLTGSLSAGMTGGKPFALADLNGGDLDLRAYMPASEAGGGDASASSSSEAAGPSDWSDDPIDMSGLSAADVDIQLRANSIRTGQVDTGKVDVAIVAKGQQATVTINELGLFDGNITGTTNVDLRKTEPVVKIRMNVANLQAQSALTQFADFADFLGTVNLAIDMTTQGNTERKLVSALNGAGRISVTDGAILGYNLAAAIRNVSTGDLNLDYDKAAKTDFAEISGTFTARNGVINNPDLKMAAPLLRAEGLGDIDLPKRGLDYRATPKLVASLSGQGSGNDRGLGVPLLITGSWDDPSIKPDLEGVIKGVLESPGDAIKGVTDTVKSVTDGSAVKGVTDAVKGVTEGGGGAVKGLLDSVTGSGNKTENTDGTETESGAGGAVKKLKGLFGN